VEGTALQTRIIFDRMQEHGAPIHRVINGGGIPKRNPTLNRIYANALKKPVLVPEGDVTSLGSVIFAFLAAGDFRTIEEAQNALCPPFKVYEPDAAESARYDRLYALFRDAYFALGTPNPVNAPAPKHGLLDALKGSAAAPSAGHTLGRILPELQVIQREAIAAAGMAPALAD
jgi:L-ribulokinase